MDQRTTRGWGKTGNKKAAQVARQPQEQGIPVSVAVAAQTNFPVLLSGLGTVQAFNTTVRSFPTNLTAMLFKYKVKPNFTVENEAAIAKPPTFDFGGGAAAPAN